MIIPNTPILNRQLQVWLVLRHYSDPSKVHRHAILPRVLICSMDAPVARDLPHLNIAISGDNVAITVEDELAYQCGIRPENHLYVFDWKMGFNKTVSQSHGKPLMLETHLELVDIPFQRLLHESGFFARRHASCLLFLTVLPSNILYSSIHDTFLIHSPYDFA